MFFFCTASLNCPNVSIFLFFSLLLSLPPSVLKHLRQQRNCQRKSQTTCVATKSHKEEEDRKISKRGGRKEEEISCSPALEECGRAVCRQNEVFVGDCRILRLCRCEESILVGWRAIFPPQSGAQGAIRGGMGKL